jgi:hypothetical protein
MGLYKAREVWTGTLASSIPDATTTSFTLTSSSGLTNGETYVFTIDRVDVNGTKTPNKKEVIIGTVSGSNVIDCIRGVEGTAQAHSAGAIVEILFTAKHWNNLIESFKAQHREDGSHKKIQGLDNNQAITQKDSAGMERSIAKINASNILEIGDSNLAGQQFNTPLVNNTAIKQKDSDGAERSIAKVNASNVLEIGDSNLANVKIISPTGSGFTGVDNYPTIVDLTNATSDYDLQIGQKAIITLSNNTSKPLRIATSNGKIYRMIIAPSNNFSNSGGTVGNIFLQPNNTTYSNAFKNTIIVRDGNNFASHYNLTFDAFRIAHSISFIDLTIQNFTTAKLVKSILLMWGTSVHFPTLEIDVSAWNDTTTAWTSLGTLVFPVSTSGKVIVERLA